MSETDVIEPKQEENTPKIPQDYPDATGILNYVDLENLPVAKNEKTGAEIQLAVSVFQRGAMEGQGFLTVPVTKDNLAEYIEFRGRDNVAEKLQAIENLSCQAALVMFGSCKEAEKDEKGKVTLKYPTEILIDKLIKAIGDGSVSGETIGQLEARKKLLVQEMAKASKSCYNPDKTPNLDAVLRVVELGKKIENIDVQISNRRRNPKDDSGDE